MPLLFLRFKNDNKRLFQISSDKFQKINKYY